VAGPGSGGIAGGYSAIAMLRVTASPSCCKSFMLNVRFGSKAAATVARLRGCFTPNNGLDGREHSSETQTCEIAGYLLSAR